MNSTGRLIIFPSPLDGTKAISTEDRLFLEQANRDEQTKIVVEDHKPARRRWISWGLDREAIDKFILFNEHSMHEMQDQILAELKSGISMVLLSDGGMPGFCDPGAELIFECHKNKIPIETRPFHNSVMLALVMSGLPHQPFAFYGFPPAKKDQRKEFFQNIAKWKDTMVLMDTPYRLNQIVDEVSESLGGRLCFLAMDLACENQELILKEASELAHTLRKNKIKREFILVIGPAGFQGH